MVTAKQLAERLEVSERTIYRDVQDLSLSGVPVEGEAGVGYMLRHTMDIPPLMFSQDEIQAIVLGARMVGTWGGKELAKAAQTAIDKIEGSLPSNLRRLTQDSHLYAYPYNFESTIFNNVDILRTSINEKRMIHFGYTREDGNTSTRTVNPLALYFWGRVWTLTSWCHLREDFRSFRIDRMTNVACTGEQFVDKPGQSLEDYLAKMKAEIDEGYCSG